MLAVFMHPQENRYDEVYEAYVNRLTKLILESRLQEVKSGTMGSDMGVT